MHRRSLVVLFFSLLVAAPQVSAQLRIVYPNGGETFRVGSRMTILWSGVPMTDTVTLECSTDGGSTWTLITNTATGLRYTWLNVPNSLSASCLIRGTDQKPTTPSTLHLLAGTLYGNADFSSDGNLVIGASGDGNTYIWDSYSAQVVRQFQTETGAGITGKALNSWGVFSPDMKTFATVSPTPDASGNGNIARVFDATTGAKLHEWSLIDPTNLAFTTGRCQFSADGTRLAASGEDSIRVFDIATEAVAAKLAGFVRLDASFTEHSIANCFDWKPDGSDIIAGIALKSDSIPTYVRASSATGDTIQTYRLKSAFPFSSVNSAIHYSPDGKLFIASTADTSVRVWDVATGSILYRIRPGLRGAVDAVISHDGKTVATVGYDSLGLASYNVKLWNALDGSFIRWVGSLGFGSGSIEFSPDDARILVSSSGNNVIFQTAQAGVQRDVSDASWSIVPNTGGNIIVYAPDVSANLNDVIDIPVRIDDPGGAVGAGASHVSFDLHFNETMLDPIGTTPLGTIAGNDRILSFNLPIVATDTTLTTLHFRVALGNDSTTKLAVASANTDVPTVTVGNRDGSFKLLGLCYAGGPRLVNPNGIVSMIIPANPVSDWVRVNVNLLEDGPTKLECYDACGRKVYTLVDEYLSHGARSYQIPARSLGTGLYYLMLQTPNNRLLAPVEVER